MLFRLTHKILETCLDMSMAVHFSSATDLWATPQELFVRLDECWHFTLDVCAIPENAKCQRYFSPLENGLKQVWTGTCWMNPPYGREISRWVTKAYESASAGQPSCAFFPPALIRRGGTITRLKARSSTYGDDSNLAVMPIRLHFLPLLWLSWEDWSHGNIARKRNIQDCVYEPDRRAPARSVRLFPDLPAPTSARVRRAPRHQYARLSILLITC